MPYYPYQPYQPMQTYQPYIPQPQNIIWVSGEQEAQMYPIAPNNAVTLWDKSGSAVYVKSADATGKPTMRVYGLVERSDSVSAPEGNVPQYATKTELEAFSAVIDGIKGDIETMRGDLYGIAGKKKPARKEVAEDE